MKRESDSDLKKSTQNAGVNSKKKFVYTTNYNLGLRESRKSNRQDSGLMWKPNLKIITERRERFTFKRLQWILQR